MPEYILLVLDSPLNYALGYYSQDPKLTLQMKHNIVL